MVTAAAVGLDRILIGVHYPIDVAVSVPVGLCSAALVTLLGRRPISWLVRLVSRLSDPVVLALTRQVTARQHDRP